MEYVKTTAKVVEIVIIASVVSATLFAAISLFLVKKEKEDTFFYALSRFIYKKSFVFLIISASLRGLLFGAETSNLPIILISLVVIAGYIFMEERF